MLVAAIVSAFRGAGRWPCVYIDVVDAGEAEIVITMGRRQKIVAILGKSEKNKNVIAHI